MARPSKEGRVTPSMKKKKVTQRRNQRHAKRSAVVNKPSWSEALKRKYIEADRKDQGKQVPAKEWGKRHNKRLRAEDEEIASDDEDYLNDDVEGKHGVMKHEDGFEIQDDVDEERGSEDAEEERDSEEEEEGEEETDMTKGMVCDGCWRCWRTCC